MGQSPLQSPSQEALTTIHTQDTVVTIPEGKGEAEAPSCTWKLWGLSSSRTCSATRAENRTSVSHFLRCKTSNCLARGSGAQLGQAVRTGARLAVLVKQASQFITTALTSTVPSPAHPGGLTREPRQPQSAPCVLWTKPAVLSSHSTHPTTSALRQWPCPQRPPWWQAPPVQGVCQLTCPQSQAEPTGRTVCQM